LIKLEILAFQQTLLFIPTFQFKDTILSFRNCQPTDTSRQPQKKQFNKIESSLYQILPQV